MLGRVKNFFKAYLTISAYGAVMGAGTATFGGGMIELSREMEKTIPGQGLPLENIRSAYFNTPKYTAWGALIGGAPVTVPLFLAGMALRDRLGYKSGSSENTASTENSVTDKNKP